MNDERLVRVEPKLPATFQPPADARERLAEALARLWASLESVHSRRGYQADWAAWVGWCEAQSVHVLAARPLHVLCYVEQLANAGKAKATRARALSSLRQVYRALTAAELILANPAREIKNPRVSKDPRTPWLAEDAVKRLLQRPDANASWMARRDWLIGVSLLGLAWRRAEIARLRRDQLISVPGGFSAHVFAKGGKEAFVSVPVWLSKLLTQWCEENNITAGPLFPREQFSTDAVGPTTVRNAIKRLAEQAGIDLRLVAPHALRRSFATITGQRGVSIEDRQDAMLHQSKTTTERYDKASKLPAQAPGEVLGDLVGLPRRGDVPE